MRPRSPSELCIVYFGPGLAGCTTNLIKLGASLGVPYHHLDTALRLPAALWTSWVPGCERIDGQAPQLTLYTVPTSIVRDPARVALMRRMDACVFVADSQTARIETNLDRMEEVAEYVRSEGRAWDQFPLVIQCNKRDLPEIMPVAALQEALNQVGAPWTEAVASRGVGVMETFRAIASLAVERLLL
jgi:hypothetical protein